MTLVSLEARVRAVLARAGLLDARVCVGLSGGIDSCVLLDLLTRIAREHPLRLSAVHVDHGLSRHASAWAAFCRTRCRDLGVDLRVSEARLVSGANLEAAARSARYAVFQQVPGDAVALAHMLDDQVETMMLRLNRGSGVRGLAGMPGLRSLPGGALLVRPLLSVSRSEIVAYAKAAGLTWVEDETNRQTHFDRNYLRHEVLPALALRFPAYRQTWARAAENLADAAELLDEVAAVDAGTETADRLNLSALRALGPARARNLLRWFVVRQGGALPGRLRLEEALRQMLASDRASQPDIAFGAVRLRRHADALQGVVELPPIPPGWSQCWRGEDTLQLEHGLGVLRFASVHGCGLSRRLLLGRAGVKVRAGGERLKRFPLRPSRTLKNLLREAGFPPWQRNRLPLLIIAGQVAWVAGVGMDCRFAAAADEEGLLPHWDPAVAIDAEDCGS